MKAGKAEKKRRKGIRDKIRRQKIKSESGIKESGGLWNGKA
jgi:hypothetical protein